MLKRLRWKFTGILMLLLCGVLAAVLTVQTVSSLQQYRAGTDQVLQSVLTRTQSALDPWGSLWGDGLARDDEPLGGNAAPGLSRATRGPRLYTAIPAFCAVVDRDGQIVLALAYNAAVDQSDVTAAVNAALADGAWEGTLSRLGLRYQIQSSGRYVEIAFADLSWEREGVRRQAASAVILFAAAAAGFFAVSWFLSRWLVRPVEEGWKRQQQFVADASHELKTPLTVLLADADILLAHQGETVESQRKWVEHIRQEGLRMKGLVQDLLFLARGDAGGRERPSGAVSLTDLCGSCVLSFDPVAFERELALDSRIAPGVSVTGSGEELRRLIAILLDNACKYCGPGGTVTVTLAAGDRAVLTVHNTGAPIPPEAQPHLFERFYRADAARSRDAGGYGLGLSIAAAIVEGHRGKIAVHSTEGEGTAFTVTLPLGQP